MKRSTVQLTLIILFFALLWAPLGQQVYLHEHWVNIGVYGTGFLLIGSVIFREDQESIFSDMRFLTVLLLVAYLFHQYEEHGTDLFGRNFAFMSYVNGIISPKIPECGGIPNCPLNPENIFYINTTLVWFLFVLVAWGGRRFAFAGLCAGALLLVNALAHILQGVVRLEYNPGLLTSVLIFVPFSFFYYWTSARLGLADKMTIVASVVWAILAHIILGVFAVIIFVYNILPNPSYLAILIAWSLVPLFLFRRVH